MNQRGGSASARASRSEARPFGCGASAALSGETLWPTMRILPSGGRLRLDPTSLVGLPLLAIPAPGDSLTPRSVPSEREGWREGIERVRAD